MFSMTVPRKFSSTDYGRACRALRVATDMTSGGDLLMIGKLSVALTLLRGFLRRQFATTPLAGMFDSYRPERHYMRGAGPKSRLVSSRESADSEQT
ncbi:MAG TPA: hypothetical protein VFB45_05100 [Pseudolabrys sp.]|nr:hypothetical protein [Pseudolabrys sp.]